MHSSAVFFEEDMIIFLNEPFLKFMGSPQDIKKSQFRQLAGIESMSPDFGIIKMDIFCIFNKP